MSRPTATTIDPTDLRRLVEGRHTDPHAVLGAHGVDGGGVVRVWRPDADAVRVVADEAPPADAVTIHHAGVFEAVLTALPPPGGYRLEVTYGCQTYALFDPYAFWPSLGDVDLHLVGEGRHEQLWQHLGAHARVRDGVEGTTFAVWAPNAQSVRVVGEFNSWDGRLHPMRKLASSGVWELFLPEVGSGARYKYELVTADGRLVTRADPFAAFADTPPGNASRVFASTHEWGDAAWLAARDATTWTRSPMSIYEVHLGSWRRPKDRPLDYRTLAHEMADHAGGLGFTHVQLLPVAEHPLTGSWGYQVSGYYAPTSRFGTPDDFRELVDHLHQRGLGVIVDWVPAHFPKDEWALARFDGTAMFEHADPRQGEHPDWGTLVFNYGRNEVRNFLVANALYWLEELHVDGLRVDAVASMLYLDYSREGGDWVPNRYGGRENLEAIEFLQELNTVVHRRNPGALMIAEESTAWPGVTRPVDLGGLGFGFKWNMGWMHDTLAYFSRDPIHRRHHHDELTFGLTYAWSEHYVLPLSHDEVVHGKASLLSKMPGDAWQQLANLRALYAWMWAHPGKPLLFMGSELGQREEWSEERELDWRLLSTPGHAGLARVLHDLNAATAQLAALWRRDPDPEGFAWIEPHDAAHNVLAFVRHGEAGDAPVVVGANLSPTPDEARVLGMPAAGRWLERLNTDASAYGGSGVGNLGVVEAAAEPAQGQPASVTLRLPPLGVLWLVPDTA